MDQPSLSASPWLWPTHIGDGHAPVSPCQPLGEAAALTWNRLTCRTPGVKRWARAQHGDSQPLLPQVPQWVLQVPFSYEKSRLVCSPRSEGIHMEQSTGNPDGPQTCTIRSQSEQG